MSRGRSTTAIQVAAALLLVSGLLGCGRLGFDAEVDSSVVEDDAGTIDAAVDAGDAGTPVDTGSPDDMGFVDTGGVKDAEPTDGNPPPTPGGIRVLDQDELVVWLDEGEEKTLYVLPLGGLGSSGDLISNQDWVSGSSNNDRWQLIFTPSDLMAGTYTATVSDGTSQASLRIRAHIFTPKRIGPTAGSCGNNACDFIGSDALIEGNLQQAGVPTHFIVYGDRQTEFDGLIETAGPRWISAASVVDFRDFVSLGCFQTSYVKTITGLIAVRHGPFKLEGLRLNVRPYCQSAINAGRTRLTGADESVELERLWIRAMAPERRKHNWIDRSIRAGDHLSLRHSFIEGHFEGGISATSARNLRIEHNTFMSHEGPTQIHVNSARDVKIAHNVSVALAIEEDFFVNSNGGANNIQVLGNYLERYNAVAEPFPNLVQQDNVLEQVPLHAPSDPMFLADAAIDDPGEPSWGLSLDRVDVTVGSRLPGAFQVRSTRSGDRNRAIVVGANCPSCDVDASETNEVQKALWLAWPHQEVILRPYDDYAGRAVVAWPVLLSGDGSAEQVVLRDRSEDPELDAMGYWRQEPVIAISEIITEYVGIKRLTLVADRAYGVSAPGAEGTKELKNIIVRGRASEAAFGLESSALLYDSMAAGDFNVCVGLGVRFFDRAVTELSPVVVNFSCSIGPTGTGLFGISGSESAWFVNVVGRSRGVSLPMFVEHGVDSPVTSVRAQNFSIANVDGIPPGMQYSLTNVVVYPVDQDLFVSNTDLRLIPGAVGIDSGGNPAGLPRPLGNDLDGVDRSGRVPDQGAYEQGM